MLRPYLQLSPLAEVFEDDFTMVPAGLHVAPHRRRDVSPCEVLRPPQNETVGWLAIAAGPAGCLIVRLERRRRPPVEHLPHVRLVDPHTKRARRDDDAHLIGKEPAQHAPAHAGTEAGVMRSGA